MFTVTDQFGGVWNVLGEDAIGSNIDRLPVQVDYTGREPLFIVYSWASHTSHKQVSIIAHTSYLADIARKYTKTKNAGLDEILISLPPRLTKLTKHKISKLLKLVVLANSELNLIGYEYTTTDGVYSDFSTNENKTIETHVLFETT